MEPSDDLIWHKRVHNSQTTRNLTKAVEWLEKQDFELWTGSGVMVNITPITPGKDSPEEFMIPAEIMEELKPVICKSIRDGFRHRIALLKSEVKSLESALDKAK